MNSEVCQKNNFFGRIKEEASLCEMLFWWITRILVILCGIKNNEDIVFYLIVTALTFSVDIIHLVFPKWEISARLQSFICSLVLLSTVVGLGLGVIENYPDYDIVLQLSGGIFTGVLGYYTALALRKPETKNEFTFVTFFSLCFSGTVTVFRKLTEFFCDFYYGTNLCHVEFIEDSHWFYRVFGLGMSPEAQRPLFDTDEDFIFSLMGAIISTAGIYLNFVLRNRNIFKLRKINIGSIFKNFIPDFKKKISLEFEKVRKDTSIYDILFWWGVRASMVYAFIVWDNRAEANLLLANLIGTFAVTLVHLVFPEGSVFSKISYKTQTLITVIVFLGSYCGNYCFVYNIVPRFDLFLHFISGTLCVLGGYYIALTLIEFKSKKDSLLAALFAFCFSAFIMPAWEVSEFIGDFIWGTSNQGFYWGPSDESFFFKVFGHGAGNTQLYYLFDTVYDVLLAIVTTVLTFIALYAFLEYKRRKAAVTFTAEEKETDTAEEKETVLC